MIHINRKSTKSNLSAEIAPTVNDDIGDGYSVGSVWVDVISDRAYICLDSTIGAAVWSELSSPDLNTTAITNPALNAAVTTAIIDGYSGTIITLTAAGNAQTLQSPTNTAAGKRFTVVSHNSNGANVVEVNGVTMSAGEAQRFIWSGSAWIAITAIDADDMAATPHGDISAVKVQSYLDELEDEKVKRVTSVDNEIVRFNGTGGDIQGYTSNAPTVSNVGLADFPGGLKAADPADEHGVGDVGFNDGRYPTKTDFHPPAPLAFAGESGRTITHNYGHTNYQLIVNPVADPGGFLGEIWFVKSDNTVVVYNSGIASGNFDYVLIPDS